MKSIGNNQFIIIIIIKITIFYFSFIECIDALYHYEQQKKAEEAKIKEHEKAL